MTMTIDEFDTDYFGTADWPDPENDRAEFLRLVDADARGLSDPETADWLRSDEILPSFAAALKAMTGQLHLRLEKMGRGDNQRYPVARMYKQFAGSLSGVNVLLKALNVRRNAERQSVAGEAKSRYLPLIRAHQRAVELSGDEPRPYDLILWQALES